MNEVYEKYKTYIPFIVLSLIITILISTYLVARHKIETNHLFENNIKLADGASLSVCYQKLSEDFYINNFNKGNLGFLGKNQLFVFDDLNLKIYKKVNGNKNHWALDESFLNKGKFTSKSTINYLSGNENFAYLDTYDVEKASFIVNRKLSGVPKSSAVVLEKAVLSPSGNSGISFSNNYLVQLFKLDASGLTNNVKNIFFEHFNNNGKNDLIVSGDYSFSRITDKYVFVVGTEEKDVVALCYQNNYKYLTRLKIAKEKLGQPNGVVYINKHYVMSGNKGISIFSEDGNIVEFIPIDKMYETERNEKYRVWGIAQVDNEVIVGIGAPKEKYGAKCVFIAQLIIK